MKGRDFIGVKLVLTEAAFRIDEKTGERTPALCPPGLPTGLLEPGLVFSLDGRDFELAIRPEDWIASGACQIVPEKPKPSKPPTEKHESGLTAKMKREAGDDS